MIKRNKLLTFAYITLVLAIIMNVAQPVYYQIKGNVAQWLMEQAWQQQEISGEVIKPWGWADTWPIFKLSFSTQDKGVSQFLVMRDTSGESLAFGPGLMTEAIMPGDIGNALIAAHRDTHFSALEKIKLGDRLFIQYADGRSYMFQIDNIQIVDSRLQNPITLLDHSRLTLVTCYPFTSLGSSTPWRMLVSGAKVESPI